MGLLTFGTVLNQERESYLNNGSPTAHSSTYPFRQLARSIAEKEDRYTQGHTLRVARDDFPSTHPLPSPTESSRHGTAPSSPTLTIAPSTYATSSSATIDSPILRGSLFSPRPNPHIDYQGRELVEVVAADYVQSPDFLRMVRYAVLEPSRPECLWRDDCVLFIGTVHLVAKLVKNHGSSEDLPLCSVIECLTANASVEEPTSIVLLAANYVVHPSFEVEERPDPRFIGTGQGSVVVELDDLDTVDHIATISPMYYRRSLSALV
ncbi:hypothetical protein C8R43DRAFT_949965 [Mycena crocata]|nr:hypothetical protein C8R43DRAFT_949965 [Mycena crocata]